jgi:hypothetical protein
VKAKSERVVPTPTPAASRKSTRVMAALAAALLLGGCTQKGCLACPDLGTTFEIQGPSKVTAGQEVVYVIDGVKGNGCPAGLQWYFEGVSTPISVRTDKSSPPLQTTGTGKNCAVDDERQSYTFPVPPNGVDSYKTTVSALLGTANAVQLLHAEKKVTVVRDPGAPVTPPEVPPYLSVQTYPEAEFPVGVAVAQLDGTGNVDVAVADDRSNPATADVVHLYTSTAGGSLQHTAELPLGAGSSPRAIASDDADRDGDADLFVSDNSGGGIDRVRVLINQGGGNFAAAQAYEISGGPDGAVDLALGDLNSDGWLDFATASKGPPADTAIRLNDRAGGFGNPTSAAGDDFTYPTGGSGPDAIAAADFNNDTRRDLAFVHATSDDLTFLRNETLTGTSPPQFPAPAQVEDLGGRKSTGIAVGEMGGDAQPDLALANTGNNTISLLKNTTAGDADIFSFETTAFPATGSDPQGIEPADVAFADLDADGRVDVLAANQGSNNVSILRNTGPGGFEQAAHLAMGTFPFEVATGDINGDGRPDIVTANDADITVALSDPAAAGTASAAATAVSPTVRPYALKAKGKAIKVKGTGALRKLHEVDRGTVTFATDGTLNAPAALVAGQLKLKLKGSKKALGLLPEALRKSIKGNALASVNVTVYPQADLKTIPQFELHGLVVAQSSKDPKLQICAKIKYDGRVTDGTSNSFKSVGATKALKRMRFVGTVPQLSLDHGAKDKIKLKVATQQKAKPLPKSCRPLLKRLQGL